jgi:hypothetical protein
MDPAPALPSIIAKTLVIIDKLLDTFASVQLASAGGACNLTQYNVTISDCGNALIDDISQLLYSLTQMGSHMLGSLVAMNSV